VLIFVESRIFARDREKYLDDDEFRALQTALRGNPDLGAVIAGTGGLRKLRWAARGSGKRGGLRIIYFVITSDHRCLLLYAYSKSAQEDLSSEERDFLKKLVQAEVRSKGE
jgi:hypothetical protein